MSKLQIPERSAGGKAETVEEWYYAQEGKQAGPVTREEIQQLIYAKRINARTLVWKQGMADWQELGSLGSNKPDSKEKAEPVDAEYVPVEYSETDTDPGGLLLKQKEKGDTAASPQSVCSQCRRTFPEHEMIRYQGSSVCAACKSLLMEKNKEEESVPAEVEYGRFWIRLGAKIIDGIALAIIQTIVSFPLGFLTGLSGSPDSAGFLIGQGLILLFSLIMPIVYTTWFLGKYAATPGKMACKLKVVSAYGEPISYARAFGRTMAEWISSLILCLGYLMAAFDEEKRTLHDRICNTRVIRA